MMSLPTALLIQAQSAALIMLASSIGDGIPTRHTKIVARMLFTRLWTIRHKETFTGHATCVLCYSATLGSRRGDERVGVRYWCPALMSVVVLLERLSDRFDEGQFGGFRLVKEQTEERNSLRTDIAKLKRAF
jgi:hypothetical protein